MIKSMNIFRIDKLIFSKTTIEKVDFSMIRKFQLIRSKSTNSGKFSDKSNGEDLHFPTNANDPVNVYKKVQTYLEVNEVLKSLDEKLRENVDALKAIDEDIMKLAQEIKGQAQAALVE